MPKKFYFPQYGRVQGAVIVEANNPNGTGSVRPHFRPQYGVRDVHLVAAWLNGEEPPIRMMNMTDWPGNPERHGARYQDAINRAADNVP